MQCRKGSTNSAHKHSSEHFSTTTQNTAQFSVNTLHTNTFYQHIIINVTKIFCFFNELLFQLSWIERKMASTLFASPPTASLPEAIDHFLQAERLKPDGWKENRLFIAKCHIGQGEYNQAVIWLDKADSIPLASADVREGIKVGRM